MLKSQIPNPKSQINFNIQFSIFQTGRFRLLAFLSLVIICNLVFGAWNLNLYAQDADIEFTIDAKADTVLLPKIFKPSIDLSGRGIARDSGWPGGLAEEKVLNLWKNNFGFSGMYRLQYDLWEINQAAKDKALQDKLLANYESIIKQISDAGGVVILDIFGTPAGLGMVLDKKSPPRDLKAFKELIKAYIRNLSCDKRYNIWYEVWSAPDLDSFFLGRRQEYLNLYRAVAESAGELESETKVHIPLGGPSVSWWFQNLEGNTIFTPERSLIYELIKFCRSQRLPLDFISWHAYSTDPLVEQESTLYKKTAVNLIRDWLGYFNFDKNTPLIISEWNYDSGNNISAERRDKSFISASYIPLRLKNLYEAGINYQLYFCLQDFYNPEKEALRNVGIFCFDPEAAEYKDGQKASYNVFKMLTLLGNKLLPVELKTKDDFTGIIATKAEEGTVLLIYNYIDPKIAMNYLSRSISGLNDAERKILLGLIKADKIEKFIRKEIGLKELRLHNNKLEVLLNKAQGLAVKAADFKGISRNVKLEIKNLEDNYLYQRYAISPSCGMNCDFVPAEEKEVSISQGVYEEVLQLEPYSVQLIILKEKPKEIAAVLPALVQEEAPQGAQSAPTDAPKSQE